MILQSLARLARDEGLLEDPDYEPKAVAVFIELAADGRFLDFKSTASEGRSGRPRPKTFMVPRQEKRAYGNKPQFLVDGPEYVLGIGDDVARAKTRQTLFTDRVRQCAEATGDPAVRAALAFLDRVAAGDRPPLPEETLTAQTLSFRIDGEALFDRPAVRAWWKVCREVVSLDGTEPQCLVCGRMSAPALIHPAVKGVAGGNYSDAALVSFNGDAFESWGHDQGDNAPVCRPCAEAYTTGLNRVLSRDYVHDGRHLDRRNAWLSKDTMVGYWSSGGDAGEVLNFLTELLDRTPEVAGRVYSSPWRGVVPQVPEGARFYALVLSGAKGRATVREWIETSFSETVENVGQHLRDLDIDGVDERPPSLKNLLCAVALQGEEKNVSPLYAVGLVRAALRGLPYPRSLLEAAVRRTRAERCITVHRAALIKAVLLRSLDRNRYPEVRPKMDPENHNPAYLCGRLLAILERLQGDAVNPSATLVDRFYGAASARPATVFGALLKTAQYHRTKARSGGYLNKLMGDVIANLPAFPLVLTLEEQGLFAIGYYHQREDFWKPRKQEENSEMTGQVGQENI